MKTKIPSPSKSQGAHTPRRKSRRTLSVGSPALSTASGRLTSVVQGFVNKQMNSFALSPLPKRRSVLTDNTDIMEEPRRKSWWKNLNENSRNVLEILDDNNLAGPEPNNIMEELDMEILSQGKKNYTLDIPESSDGESIHSIILPQRKLFNQKESQHQKKFGQIIGTRESMTKSKNMTMNDKVVNAGTKELFQNKPRSKLLFPPALLDISPDKTLADKTKEFATEPETQPRNIFGNRQGAKRKNMFADFIVTESEDEIPEIQPRVFGFPKKPELIRRGSSASRGIRESSPTSNATTDTEMDEWRMLPSSTMVEHQLEAMMEQNTPKRLRLSKLTETKESSDTSRVSSKTKSPELNTSVLTRSRLRALNNSGTSTVGGKDKTQDKSELNQSKMKNQHDQSQNNKSRGKLKEVNINSEQNGDQSTDISHGKMNKSKGKHNKSLHKTNVSLKVNDEIVNKSQKIGENEQEVVDGNKKLDVALEANQCQDHTDDKQEQQNEIDLTLENSEQKVIAESQEVEESEEVNESKEIDENEEVEQEDENQEGKSENEESQEVAEESDKVEVDKSQDRINESQDEDEEQANESQTHFNESIEQEDEGQAADQNRQEANKSNEAINKSQVDESQEEEEVDENNQAVNESNIISDQSQEEVDESNPADDESNPEEDEGNEAVNHTQEVDESNEVQNESHLAIEDDENEVNEDDEESQDEVNESNVEQNETQEEDENEVQNESQLDVEDDENETIDHENTQEEVDESNVEENDENEAVEEENEIQNESQLSVEDDEHENTQEEVDESKVEENEAVADEDESAELHYESASEEMEADDEPQNDEDGVTSAIDQENEINQNPEPADNEYNISHDTTGRNRNKHTSPEAILHDKTKQSDSFSTRRNTSIRKTKSVVNLLNDKPSLMPARDSVGFSDGTTNSSAEGSGWDSHRTTRKTIRQTFGRDATPRKSLRALVMEKSAKRHTLASETAKFPLANSTAVPEISLGYLDIQPFHQESTHEVSLRTRQLTLDAVLEKIKKDNLKKKAEIEESVKKSLETHSDNHIFKVPLRPMFPRRQSNKENKTSKVKPIWRGLPEEMIEDLQYRPPKRFKPSNAAWITKRLYKYLENKLEPKYDYKARVRAEKFVETLYNFTKDLRRQSAATEDATNVLKHEMARLQIVRTHHEFYEFFRQFMPKEIRIKVIPDVVNKISLPRRDVFTDIIVLDSAQG